MVQQALSALACTAMQCRPRHDSDTALSEGHHAMHGHSHSTYEYGIKYGCSIVRNLLSGWQETNIVLLTKYSTSTRVRPMRLHTSSILLSCRARARLCQLPLPC
jgi:hypothetical protein